MLSVKGNVLFYLDVEPEIFEWTIVYSSETNFKTASYNFCSGQLK